MTGTRKQGKGRRRDGHSNRRKEKRQTESGRVSQKGLTKIDIHRQSYGYTQTVKESETARDADLTRTETETDGDGDVTETETHG